MNLYEQIGEENIDLLVSYMYDDIIPNDDRINLLFSNGFDKIKIEQKKFFRLFLGEPGHSIFATPDLRRKHMKLPISIREAKYWLEDFELALERLDIDPSIKKFFSQKINSLTMQMINTNLIYAFILYKNSSSLWILFSEIAPWILVNNHSLTGLHTSSGKSLSNNPSARSKRQFSNISLHFSAIIGESSEVSIANKVNENPLCLHALPLDIKRSKTAVKYSSKVPNFGEIVLNSFFTLQFILSNASM